MPNATGNFYTFTLELGKVQRAGLFDWKCWKLDEQGFREVLQVGGDGFMQGRIIVQRKGVRQL